LERREHGTTGNYFAVTPIDILSTYYRANSLRKANEIMRKANKIMISAIGAAVTALGASPPSGSPTSKLQRVQQAWRDIAQVSAQHCFTTDGKIDHDKTTALQSFWKNASLKDFPFSGIPGIKLVKEQTLAVLEKLLMSESPLMKRLDEAATKTPSLQGKIILGTMKILHSKYRIPRAILQSLFTPHRQMCLPTCSINALINAEIFNHPERLANIYTQILTMGPGNDIILPLPPNNRLQLQPVDGLLKCTKVTFNQYERSMKNAFQDLAQNPSTTPVQDVIVVPGSYKTYGIGVSSSPLRGPNPETISFSLDLPVHDLNDIFFANFVHTIYTTTDQSNVFIEVRNRYFGVPGDNFLGGQIFNADQGSPPDNLCFSADKIGELIGKARGLRGRGISYGLATVFASQATISSPPRTEELSPYYGHVENINLEQLASLDIDHLRQADLNKIWAIGDRNWVNNDTGAPTHLSIVKRGDDQFLIVGTEYSSDGNIIFAPGILPSGLAIYPPN
jgi:hypothetical protein